MPICTNPKCGEISKISSQICPFCGQKSLSQIDKNQVNGDKSTDDVPAPRERVIPKGSTKKPRRPFWNRPKD
jgi:hypothetical protein